MLLELRASITPLSGLGYLLCPLLSDVTEWTEPVSAVIIGDALTTGQQLPPGTSV